MTLLLLALLGCNELGLAPDAFMDDTGITGDSGGLLAELRIDAVTPSSGSTSGGTTVTITGAGFDSAASVFFGNTELDTVTYVNESTLSLTTPSAAVEVPVDITVISALGEVVLRDGFTYDDDATDTGGGGGGGGGTDPTGLTAGLVEFYMQAYACPDCFGVTGVEQVTAGVVRHAPVSASWLSWLPATGTCSASYTPPNLGVTGMSVGNQVFLSTGGSSISLSQTVEDGLLQYRSPALQEANYTSSAQYDLSTSDGSWTLEGALMTTATFTDIQPSQILVQATQGAWRHPISASNATFSWAPSGTSDDILVMLEVYHPLDMYFMGTILCRGSDMGTLTIPSSSFATYYADSPTNISIYRVRTQQITDPSDGNTVESLALYGYIGTGKLVP